jgi:hypothetical protein
MLDDVVALSENDELLENGVDELVIEAELDDEDEAEDDLLGGVDEQAELLDLYDEED